MVIYKTKLKQSKFFFTTPPRNVRLSMPAERDENGQLHARLTFLPREEN